MKTLALLAVFFLICWIFMRSGAQHGKRGLLNGVVALIVAVGVMTLVGQCMGD